MIYILETAKRHPKLYLEVLEGLYELISNPIDESGIDKIPGCIKDLLYISKLDHEFTLNENDIDYQKYI